MRILFVPLFLLGSSIVAAQPAPEPPPEQPPSESPPEPPPPPPPPEPVAPAPPSTVPPITITITNNNTGNNNNTNTATNTAPVTVSTPVTVTTTVEPPPLPPLVRPEITGPGDVRFTSNPVEVVRRDRPQRWLLVGALGSHDGGGMRASFDLFARRRLAFGIAASATGEGGHGHHGDEHDARGSAGVVGYIAWTRPLGRIQMRAQFGLGFGATGRAHAHDDSAPIARTVGGTPDDPHDGAHPELGARAEAALLFALPLGRHLGLVAGPVITATGAPHHEHGDDPSVDTSGDAHRGRGNDAVDCGVFAGLVWRR